MKLYIFRHGESAANASGTYSGWSNVPLSEKGRAQAGELGRHLEGMHFDRIFCSDLLRARTTLELALPGAEYTASAALREMDVGSLTGRKVADCDREYGESCMRNRLNRNFIEYGGEDLSMLAARIGLFMREAETLPDETIAVFAHQGAMMGMLDLVTGTCTVPWQRIACPNCCAALFEFTGERWRMVRWNLFGE